MATTRKPLPVARHASLATVALLSFMVASAWAGTPAMLDEGAPVKPKPAAVDTSKKSTKKPVTTKSATTAPTTAVKPAATSPTVAKAAPGTPSKTSVTPSKTATTATKTTTPAMKPTAVPTGIARVAPPPTSSGTVAKIPAGTKPAVKPSTVPTGIARIPAAPGGKTAVTTANTPSVTRLTPTRPVGSTLATNGGTTVTGPSVTPVKPGTSAKAGVALGSAVSGGVASKPTPGTKAGSPLSQKGGATVSAALEDHVTYQYNALGRRDPFQSLMEGDFVGEDVGGDAPPDLGGLKLVGVVWGSSDQFAMVEDPKGGSYVLRRGDRVMNGYVEGLKRDAMIVNITVDGQSQSVTIPITRKGDKSNANR